MSKPVFSESTRENKLKFGIYTELGDAITDVYSVIKRILISGVNFGEQTRNLENTFFQMRHEERYEKYKCFFIILKCLV